MFFKLNFKCLKNFRGSVFLHLFRLNYALRSIWPFGPYSKVVKLFNTKSKA